MQYPLLIQTLVHLVSQGPCFEKFCGVSRFAESRKTQNLQGFLFSPCSGFLSLFLLVHTGTDYVSNSQSGPLLGLSPAAV